jgi:transcriptional regulator with XRE-family HTH domain
VSIDAVNLTIAPTGADATVGTVEESGIGTRLRAARERSGWTREALAVRSGLSWSAIAQVESGRRKNVRPQTLAALAEALGVTIDYFVHGVPSNSVMLNHQALLYETDQEFVDTVVPFLREGIECSDAVLIVTANARIELVREHLGSEVEFVDSEGWLTSPSAALQGFVTFVSERVHAGAPWVRIVGEPIWAGRSDSEVALWTRFEALFNLVFAASPMTVICPYDTRSVPAEVARQAGCTHPHTIGPKGIARSPDYADPGGFVLGP